LTTLKDDLERAGFTVFLDLRNMAGDITKKMETNIDSSNTVLLIATPRLKTRSQIQTTNIAFEVEQIRNKRKKENNNLKAVIPIIRSGDHATSVPEDLKKILCLDFSDDDKYIDVMSQLSPLGLIPMLKDLDEPPQDKPHKDAQSHYEAYMNLFERNVAAFTQEQEELFKKMETESKDSSNFKELKVEFKKMGKSIWQWGVNKL